MDSSTSTQDSSVSSIGFTGKNAERFFTLLTDGGVTQILDVRLQNTSQLAGFAKKDDLSYFLKKIGGIKFLEVPELAPDAKLLKDYKNKLIDWPYYELKYVELITKRSVETVLSPDLFDNACLLCSEHLPHKCHRRLAIEYLNSKWKNKFKVKHLV